jgi:hypothetical protein
MSFEKPPTTPTTESTEEKPKIPTLETTTVGGTEEFKENKSYETTETASAFLNSENQSFWGRMSGSGKRIASQAYEGLYKIPGVNRVVGKMEIAYNQFWIDKHEEKLVEFKNKMDRLGLKSEAFEQSKKEIESVIENLKQENIPGVESLELKVKVIDQQKINLLNEKNKVQSKFEARENKIKLYTNERDRVADKLIGRYEEKLKPMEKELENLQTCKDQADLVIAVTEVKHKEQIAKLDGIEKRKTQVEEALRRTGMSEKEIRKFEAVKTLEGFLSQGRENIRTEKENLSQRKAEINAKIAKVDAKANTYRDKREEFTRVKEGRPLKINVEFKGTEGTTSHTRAENSGYESSRTYERESSVEAEEETVEEDKERLKILDYISGWNSYLQEKYGKKLPGELIDPKDFLRSTRLSAEHKLDFKDLKNILTKYYKFRKIPADKLNNSIDKFFAEKIKVENS